MAYFLTALVLLPALAVAFSNWRYGLFACVLVAILQDPLRKLAPGEPVYYVLLVGVVFGAAFLAAWGRVSLDPNRIAGWRRNLGMPFNLFLLLLAAQAVNAYLQFGSPVLVGIGLLSYLAPLPALILGYQYAKRGGIRGIERWLWFYIAAIFLALISVYLEYMGVSSPVFGEVGPGIAIYDRTLGLYIEANCGLFRASEVAAWHAGTAACILFLLGTERRLTIPRVLIALVLVGFLVGVGLLTGRRKMLVEIGIFLSTYLFLAAMFRKERRKLAVVAVLFGVLSYIAAVGLFEPDPAEKRYHTEYQQQESYLSYVDRGKTVIEDIPERLAGLGIAPIEWAIDQFGLFGAGLGTGSQGAQHFSGGTAVFGGAAEGGLGKITMELGLPGLLLVAWLAVAMMQYIWRVLDFVSAHSPRLARLSYGFFALLVANGAVFSVATQVFGDVFVLLVLGLMLGFLLAMPVLAEREHRSGRPAKAGVRPGASDPKCPAWGAA
ncbi:MAG TPA: hypothetical protein PK018_11165 [Candidatus Competibacter sp.]|nr:hypothetical protein [Candidatus Competibacteraceae bacterium]HPE72706.1 hypothetical protein [Candidatus Competibacter sp.]HRW67193.1 hypothetical protein [Candidatus Competibacter sp.]